MSKTMKKVSALLLALLMIFSFMPMTQETAFAAAKKPGKVKSLKIKVSGKKMTITWKKAKNAKKYKVTIKDNSTKLTATKTTKKKKLNVTGQYNTKYTITVQGVNKNGKAGKKAKKSAKTEVDPAYTKAKDDKAAAEQKAADAEQKAADAEKKATDAEAEAAAAKAAAEQAQKDKEAADQKVVEAEKAKADAEAERDQAKIAQAVAELEAAIAEAEAADAKAKTLQDEAYIKTIQAVLGSDFNSLEEAQDALREKEDDEKERMSRSRRTELRLDSWNPEVKDAINSMIKARSLGYEDHSNYVVFDFDNTCSIFDVEEQLAVFQLQRMAFAESMSAQKLEEVLWTGLNADEDPALDATYTAWIHDIVAAYEALLATDYAKHEDGQYFEPYGLDDDDAEEIQKLPAWKEFATKMRAMYDLVYDNESASVAYPWVLYWFTGMSHDDVYDLAYRSHDYYRAVPTTEVTWTTAGYPDAMAGDQEITWTSGTAVSTNIVELMTALDNAGIDVWVCSASAVDPIRAAIDVWGLHNHVTGVMAMTNVYDDKDDEFINEYDYATGYAWKPRRGGAWREYTELGATEAQTQGKGKVTAIQNVCGPKYGMGPIAGFMDSTGDFNFCSEFKDLEVVVCFNRASRKVTDGGGLAAEVACYEADAKDYDYAGAQKAGDILYVLQGRDERDFRGLLNLQKGAEELEQEGAKDTDMYGRLTIRYTGGEAQAPKVFANDDNRASLEYFTNKKLDVEDIMNTYALKTAADDPKNKLGFKYGFLSEYDGYQSQTGDILDNLDFKLELESWNPEVKEALNRMILANGTDEETGHKYVVFDFDNTCSIFDVEEQLAVYQLQKMAFAETMTPEKLEEVLWTGLNADGDEKLGKTYTAWINDIVYAYDKLLKKYGDFDTVEGEKQNYRFTPDGRKTAIPANDADWLEFATKMRAMYDLVYDNESAAVAYPWVLYWFTGMTHKEVYDLAYASHTAYKDVDTSEVTWTSPKDYKHGTDPTEAGQQKVTWTSGVAVSENINELMAALDLNGIDVWVCSASAVDPIRAAIDVWGLHPFVTGVMAMTNVYDGVFVNQYDYENGHAWYTKKPALPEGVELPKERPEFKPGEKPELPEGVDEEKLKAAVADAWEEGTVATQAQTQGAGKSTAINSVLVPEYGMGPIAGFMDSTGDFNFCTEFNDLQVVCCFNRASRKVTDGGGLVAEVAVYEADTLGYNYAIAKANGDTLYVLQGREENGKRELRPYRTTMRYGKDEPKLFANDDNWDELEYFEEKLLPVGEIFDTFSIKTPKEVKENPFSFKYGFLEDYVGYHWYPNVVPEANAAA